MNMSEYDARRRLLGAALNYAATVMGPEDETNSPYYDGAVEMYEEMLDTAAIEYVQVMSDERKMRVAKMYASAQIIDKWPEGDINSDYRLPSYTDHDPGIYCDRVHPEQDHGQWMESG